MGQLRVSLPENLQHYVDERVAAEGFADSTEFVRDLVQRDQAAHAADVARVQALIDEGIASGVVDAEPEEILNDIIAGLHRQYG